MKYTAIILSLFIFITPFVLAQEIKFEEYSHNPVFDPTMRAYYPSVIFDSNKFSGHGNAAYYKMWYNDGNGNIYLTESLDGISWGANTLVSGLSSAQHPIVVYDANGFGSGIYYKIWYWSGNVDSIGSIRYAESNNGLSWTNDQSVQQHATDPSLQLVTDYSQFNHYFYHLYGPGYIIYNPVGSNIGSLTPDNKNDDQAFTYKYIMYYDSSSEGSSPNGTSEDTSLAYSTDGIYWIRYGNKPVLISSGNSNDWDGKYSYRVSIVKIDGVYHLWYSGANGLGSDYYAQGIGHATSIDGINWVRDSKPVFHINDGKSWRKDRTYTPSVIYDLKGFEAGGCPNLKMWFTGKTSSEYTINYANTCVKSAERKMSLPVLYNVKMADLLNPSSNIHYIVEGKFIKDVILVTNIDNIFQIGVENKGILKAKNITLSVEEYPSCIDIHINPVYADIPPKSIYYYEVTIKPKCNPGTYKIKFKVEGKNISQEKELVFRVE
ncbi:MAG TPA: hypothetical protein PKY52_01325 [Methanofastidiosum sp.]|nr:hypothetical protein [Methanofastidiosum sp.]HOR88533.1 hypothetical protein [Methanofastidiosum sp.]